MIAVAQNAASLDSASRLADRTAALRYAFDRSFAAPLRINLVSTLDLLAIRVEAEPYAMRLSDIAGLFADRSITAVPTGNPALLGLAGFRGAVVPVYGLGRLLGHSEATTQTPRWLIIAAATPVAFAFDVFDGHQRATAEAIVPQQAKTHSYAPEFIRAGDVIRPVLHLPSVIAALGGADHGGAPSLQTWSEEL
jgi:chemotaxis signal transduction protein